MSYHPLADNIPAACSNITPDLQSYPARARPSHQPKTRRLSAKKLSELSHIRLPFLVLPLLVASSETGRKWRL
ncbi:hypothetical protein MY4824_001492 [Beauveria thailandica]